MKKNVTSGCILPSIAGGLLKIPICHFTSIRSKCLFYLDRQQLRPNYWERNATSFVFWLQLEEYF